MSPLRYDVMIRVRHFELHAERHDVPGKRGGTPGAAGRQIMIAVMVVIIVVTMCVLVPVVMFRTNPFMYQTLQHGLTERKRGTNRRSVSASCWG